MPDHLIRRGDVERWLADSVVTTVTYHRTSETSARRIIEQGMDLGASRIGSFGQGFYTATESDDFYGPVALAVAVRTRSPLYGTAEEVGQFVDRVAQRVGPRGVRLTAAVARAIRRELLLLGYDGIVAKDAGGDGIDYVVAIKDGTVKVVVDR